LLPQLASRIIAANVLGCVFMLVDYLQPFSFERSNLRGAIVRLNKSYQTIMRQHNYPEPVQKRLAETLLSSVLLASSIKF